MDSEAPMIPAIVFNGHLAGPRSYQAPSPPQPFETTYCGRPLSEFSKDELIDIINRIAVEHHKDRQEWRRTLDNLVSV